MRAKFIHICQDEKFINSAYNQFEELYPENNLLLVYGCSDKILNHIKISKEKIIFLENIDQVTNFIDSNGIIIFHSLPDHILRVLDKIDTSIPIVWLLFGYETYGDSSLYSFKNQFDKLTYRLFNEKSLNFSIKEHLKFYLFPLIRNVKKDLYVSKIEHQHNLLKEKIKRLKQVDYFGFAYKDEYEYQCKLLKFERPFFNFLYYPLERIVNINQLINSNKNVIMIGHSGFPNGNHLDIINKIKEYKIGNSILKIPFSYGNANYINAVKPYLLQKRSDLHFIEEFVPLEEYNIFLNDVKVAIFNNRRQQAVGNIIALLFMGAKIFLSERNTFLHFLKDNKIKIYSYENQLTEDAINKGLTLCEIENNRKILFSLFNAKKLKEELQNSINNVLKHG